MEYQNQLPAKQEQSRAAANNVSPQAIGMPAVPLLQAKKVAESQPSTAIAQLQAVMDRPFPGPFIPPAQLQKEAKAPEVKPFVPQRKVLDEEAVLQSKIAFTPFPFPTQAAAPIQAKAAFTPFPIKVDTPVQRKANNTGLPDNLKTGVENLSGFSMDDVKVYYNSDKPAQLQALAYAQGTDIHIAPGQEQHLPHEAWHVVQQKQGRVQPTTQLKQGVAVNDNQGLEKEADVMGERALQAKTDEINTYSKKSVIPSPTIPIAQRKMGVEYETKWTLVDEQTRSANHKKMIHQGDGFHIESDNNDLEFVSMPPSETAAELYNTVGKMATLAQSMITRATPQPIINNEAGPFLKPDAEEIVQNLSKETLKFKDVLEEVVENAAMVTDTHVRALVTKLHRLGWTTEDEAASNDVDALTNFTWEKGMLHGNITIDDFPFGKRPSPTIPPWKDTHALRDILGTEPKEPFNTHQLLVIEGERTMMARPQFTFGIEMAKIPKLFEMFITGVKGAEQTPINYKSTEKSTLEKYSKDEIGSNLTAANKKATTILSTGADALNEKSKGFIHYFIYYIYQARNANAYSKDVDRDKTHSTSVGQLILENTRQSVGSEDQLDLNRESFQKQFKYLSIKNTDLKSIEALIGNKTIAELIDSGKITKRELENIKEFVDANINKMKNDPVYPKHLYLLMNRSGFDHMYDGLDLEQKQQVNTFVEEEVIPKFFEQDKDDVALFSSPYYYKQKTGADTYKRGVSYGPTLREWWASIKDSGQRTQVVGGNRDKLSPPKEFITHENKPDETQSLGSLNRLDGELTVIELRQWGNVVPASDWQNHTADMLRGFVKKIYDQNTEF